jgi:hypothetical protein
MTRKISLFVVAGALIASGFAVRASAPANAPVTPSTNHGIETHQLMATAKDLPTTEFVDYTFVFAEPGR